MRKLIYIPLASIGFSVIAFRLLKFDSDQMSSGGIGIYSYIPGFALFLLFVAFALLFVLSAILSRRLRPPMALLLGIVVLAAAVVTWMSLLPSVNVHYWTFTLLIVPVILFLCGFLLFLVGAITRRGETLGVYVPTRRKRPKTADLSELKAAADRLAKALADVDEEEFVAEFKELRRRGNRTAH